MNFTNNRYDKMMKQRPQPMAPSVPKAPRGSRCAGCPYWRGIRWMACSRELVRTPDGR